MATKLTRGFASVISRRMSSSYTATLGALFGRHGVKLGLERTKALLALTGNPEKKFQVVHVAGTNGKGSVVDKIGSGLEASNVAKVGVYSSPHLLSFRERIKVNGRFVSEDQVVKLASQVTEVSDKSNLDASFFELTTVMAMLHFANENCNVAVVEAGIGGRFDATTAIEKPILTVITSIGWDHMQCLGNSLDAIAKEKAGILRDSVPVILGHEAAKFDGIMNRATELKCPVHVVEPGPPGEFFDIENRRIARKALECLGVKPDDEILACRPPFRFWDLTTEEIEAAKCSLGLQPQQKIKRVVVDVGHNRSAIARVLAEISRCLTETQKIRILITLGKERQLSLIRDAMEESDVWCRMTEIMHLPSRHVRLKTPTEIEGELRDHHTADKRFVSLWDLANNDDVGGALRRALTKCSEDDAALLICGSFYCMEEVSRYLGKPSGGGEFPVDPFDVNEPTAVPNCLGLQTQHA